MDATALTQLISSPPPRRENEQRVEEPGAGAGASNKRPEKEAKGGITMAVAPGGCRGQHVFNDLPEPELARRAALRPSTKLRVDVDVAIMEPVQMKSRGKQPANEDGGDGGSGEISADADADADENEEEEEIEDEEEIDEEELVPSRLMTRDPRTTRMRTTHSLRIERVPITVESDIIPRWGAVQVYALSTHDAVSAHATRNVYALGSVYARCSDYALYRVCAQLNAVDTELESAWFLEPLNLECDIMVSKFSFQIGQLVPLHRAWCAR